MCVCVYAQTKTYSFSGLHHQDLFPPRSRVVVVVVVTMNGMNFFFLFVLLLLLLLPFTSDQGRFVLEESYCFHLTLVHNSRRDQSIIRKQSVYSNAAAKELHFSLSMITLLILLCRLGNIQQQEET